MPAPVPTPTAEQLVIVGEIMMMSDTASVLSIVSADAQDISNAKWARTLLDITTWASIADEANDIKKVGSIEFFENTIGMSRLSFRNKLLARYGQALLVDETGGTIDAVSSLEWF